MLGTCMEYGAHMQGFLLTKLYDIKHLLYYNFLPQYSLYEATL